MQINIALASTLRKSTRGYNLMLTLMLGFILFGIVVFCLAFVSVLVGYAEAEGNKKKRSLK